MSKFDKIIELIKLTRVLKARGDIDSEYAEDIFITLKEDYNDLKKINAIEVNILNIYNKD